jgi:hypothetical protein
LNPAEWGSPKGEWLEDFEAVVNLPQMAEKYLQEEVEGLSLESFLVRLL